MILAALGIRPQTKASEPTPLPYGLRDAFLSPAESSFFHVLKGQLGAKHHLIAKVRLADLFFVRKPSQNRSAFNRIGMKHVDFVLCDAMTMQPVLGIELDDASHQKRQRIERDEFVDEVFAEACLPLLHIPAARSYSTDEVMGQIRGVLNGGPPAESSPPPLPSAG